MLRSLSNACSQCPCCEGHIVATSPAFSHRLDGVFKDADQFKPERFREPVEDKKEFGSFIGQGGY